jgi:HD-like signal output (HDOD) protein
MTSETKHSIDILNEIVGKIHNNTLQLASLPDIIVRINEVINDEHSGMTDVARVVQHDISLTARIVQIANSPQLRGNYPVTTVFDAINRLGITLVKNLAICVSFRDKLASKHSRYFELMEREIAHSLKHSIYGSVLSKEIEDIKPDALLISGLIGKIGELVTIRYIDETEKWQSLPHEEAEHLMTIIGPAVGELILRMWEFPESVRTTIFSTDEANIIAPVTSHDVFVLVQKFVACELPEDLSLRVQEYLDEHAEDVHALEDMFR